VKNSPNGELELPSDGETERLIGIAESALIGLAFGIGVPQIELEVAVHEIGHTDRNPENIIGPHGAVIFVVLIESIEADDDVTQ